VSGLVDLVDLVPPILAHGFGISADDLPIPLWIAQYGAAVVLLVSFVVLGVAWRDPRFERRSSLDPSAHEPEAAPAKLATNAAGTASDIAMAVAVPSIPAPAPRARATPEPTPRSRTPDGAPPEGRPLPAWCQRFADAPATLVTLRGLGLAAAIIVLIVAAFGPGNPVANPAPTWVLVWFWIGIVPLSLLLGPVWRWLNPLRALSALLARLSGDPEERAARPLPERGGYWPAAAGLFAFTWLELAHGEPSQPVVLLGFLVGYGLVQLGFATRFGSAWFGYGDAFEVYSAVIGRFSPLARGDDGRVVLRNPFVNLATLPRAPGMFPFIAVMLGSTGFDGISQTSWWGSLTAGLGAWPLRVASTVGLLGAIALVALSFSVAVGASRHLLDQRTRETAAGDLVGAFAHTLVPIAVGYTIAHYCSLFLLQGQVGYMLASDPLGRGWDLFGTIDWQISYGVADPTVLGLIQVGAIVIGHVLGAVAAHDRAVAIFPPRSSTMAQYPTLAVMVVYSMLGIGLVVG
jgi:hypothetical protein